MQGPSSKQLRTSQIAVFLIACRPAVTAGVDPGVPSAAMSAAYRATQAGKCAAAGLVRASTLSRCLAIPVIAAFKAACQHTHFSQPEMLHTAAADTARTERCEASAKVGTSTPWPRAFCQISCRTGPEPTVASADHTTEPLHADICTEISTQRTVQAPSHAAPRNERVEFMP